MNQRLITLRSAMYQLLLEKQGEMKKYSSDNSLESLYAQQRKWLEANKVLEEELLSGRPISQMKEFAATVAGFSGDQLKKIRDYLVSEDATEAEAIKSAKIFEEYLISEGLFCDDSGFTKEAIEFKAIKDSFFDNFGKFKMRPKVFGVFTKALGLTQVIYGLYNIFSGYRNESNVLCDKYGFGHFEPITHPEKIKNVLLKHKDDPDAVMDLVKLASYTRHWILAFLDAGGGFLDLIVDILTIAGAIATPATFGLSAGAATFLQVANTINNILQIYAGPKAVEIWFGATFDSAKIIINQNLDYLNKKIKEEEAKGEKSLTTKQEDEPGASVKKFDPAAFEKSIRDLSRLMDEADKATGAAAKIAA